MVCVGTIFTNDRFPRAATNDLMALRSSDPDEHTQLTLVRAGATIGAGCIIGSNLEIGHFAMIGMGAVVTRSVSDFHLVLGNPARSIGCVCRCGEPLAKWDDGDSPGKIVCSVCGLPYEIIARKVRELAPPDAPSAAALSSQGSV